MENLAEGTLRTVNLAFQRGWGTVFFLDKSARPCAHLFLETWHQIHPKEKPPKIKFINISSDLRSYQQPSETEKWVRQVSAAFKDVKDENIGIVDEFVESGSTIRAAKRVISDAFPEARITCTAMFEELPFWYSCAELLGVREEDESIFTRPITRKSKDARTLRQELTRLSKGLSSCIRPSLGNLVKPLIPIRNMEQRKWLLEK